MTTAEFQSQEPVTPTCTKCMKIEGETTQIGQFTLKDARHTYCGKVYSHACGCVTTATCQRGVGAPETDKLYGTFSSVAEIQKMFPLMELQLF